MAVGCFLLVPRHTERSRSMVVGFWLLVPRHIERSRSMVIGFWLLVPRHTEGFVEVWLLVFGCWFPSTALRVTVACCWLLIFAIQIISINRNFRIELVKRFKIRAQKKASYLHHTATTNYPCCVPALGDSKGASCVGLANCKFTIIF